MDHTFFDQDCEIPDEMDSDSPISPLVASTSVKMADNVLVRNKGHLKFEDKLDFTLTANISASVRNVPAVSIDEKRSKLKKGVSVDQKNLLTSSKRRSRRSKGSRRPKSQLKIKKSKLHNSKKNIRGVTKKPLKGRKSKARRSRGHSIDKQFSSTAFLPLYNKAAVPSASVQLAQQDPDDFATKLVTGKFSPAGDLPGPGEFTTRGITMKDILPVPN